MNSKISCISTSFKSYSKKITGPATLQNCLSEKPPSSKKVCLNFFILKTVLVAYLTIKFWVSIQLISAFRSNFWKYHPIFPKNLKSFCFGHFVHSTCFLREYISFPALSSYDVRVLSKSDNYKCNQYFIYNQNYQGYNVQYIHYTSTYLYT